MRLGRRTGGARRRGAQAAIEPLEPRHLLSTTTLYPVADTFTRSGVNAGSATTLEVRDNNAAGGDWMAYIRFDLSGVDLTGVTNAYLTLQKIGGDTIVPDRFDVFGLPTLPGNTPQNWNEATLATSGLGAEYTTTGGNFLDTSRVVSLNEDGLSPANVIEQVTNSGAAQHLSGVDLVQFLRDRKADGGLATFITLVDAGANRGWRYGSREAADPAFRPTLRLEYVPAYAPTTNAPARQMEDLDRGLIALRRATTQVYLGWRLLGTDSLNIGFNVYRSANGSTPIKLTATPITTSTNYVDTSFNAAATNTYFVRPVLNGVEQEASEALVLAANAPTQQHLDIPLDIPAGGTVPDVNNPGQFVSYAYEANDASVADLDGDGQYEIILKWNPTNSNNAAFAGYTGSTIFDAYKLDGTHLWRIDLGINIRSGAQYTPFLAYDLDGDGKAEFVSRTMPGTMDGLRHNVALPGDDPNADYRDSSGRITTGPEYLSVFNGETGAVMTTVPFLPDREDISTWGDAYGHRGENILLAPAYLDGSRPSIVVGRGIFGPSGTNPARNELTAWNWRDGELTLDWWFRADVGINDDINSEYVAQGVYNMIPADVDGDGRDEIVFGAMVVDDDGTGLYSTGRGHGDALHVTDMDPSNPGLEIFMPIEDTSIGNHTAAVLRDAATGTILAAPLVSDADVAAGSFPDVGRGIALDIDPNHPGYEFWDSYDPFIYDAQGNPIYGKPSNMHVNFGIWWDADLLRETLDGTTIGDWNYTTAGRSNLVSYANKGINANPGLASNNGTKSNPCLVGDILGDWREEVIWRTSDSSALQIWSTTIPSTDRIYTLVHDSQYRESLAWQNVGYNQPPNPSYFLGAGMAAPTQPNIYLAGPDSVPPPTIEVITVAAGQVLVDSQARAGNLAIVKEGAGTLVLTAAAAFPGGVTVHSGTVVIQAAGAIGTGGLVLKAGEVRLEVGYDAVPLTSLVIAGGRLDLGTGRITLAPDSFDATLIRHWLTAGRNGGGWDGEIGIVSRAAGSSVLRAVGSTVTDAGLTIGWAAPGDTNLDGVVNIFDLTSVLSGGHYNAGGTAATWEQGDFNADGRVDLVDLVQLNAAGLFNGPSYRMGGGTAAETGRNPLATAFALLVADAAATGNGKKISFAP